MDSLSKSCVKFKTSMLEFTASTKNAYAGRVIFGSIILTGLQASIEVACSCSSHPLLCALKLHHTYFHM